MERRIQQKRAEFFALAVTAVLVASALAQNDRIVSDVLPPLNIANEDSAQPVRTAARPIEAGAGQAISPINGELIHERYSNGSVKIARHVIQDGDGNFFNEGSWKLWTPDGQLIADGHFHNGQRNGKWVRRYSRDDSPLFKTSPYSSFEAPFTSEATFRNGKIDGQWIIVDAKQRTVSEWKFENGIREGVSLWYYPSGREMRSIPYVGGDIDGQYEEWNEESTLTRNDKFVEGRQLAVNVTYYKGNKSDRKLTEGSVYRAQVVVKTDDDWWNARPATFTVVGNEEKHGPWTSWYENGQMKQKAEYKMGLAIGQFIAWHSNGQVAIEGAYEAGQPTGEWTWRHENGMKKAQGRYVAGTPVGPWSWWKEDGKITQRADYSGDTPKTASRPDESEEGPGRSILLPTLIQPAKR